MNDPPVTPVSRPALCRCATLGGRGLPTRLPWLCAALLLALLVLGALVAPRPAMAADTNVPVASVSVQRLDATVTKTTLVTAFATSRDVVDVYNYVPVQVSADWRLATSMEDATWVFKPGGGAPKLAIFFTTEGGKHVARLYDDQLAGGAAPVTIKNNRVVLSLPLHWTVQAATVQPWTLPDGRPATDLTIEGAFSLPHEDDALSFVAHRWHGHDAWDFRLVDPTGSGVPQYSLLRLFPQVALTAAVPHTQLDINVADYRVGPFSPTIFWPYLGSATITVRAWFDRRPPLSMDWASGQLRDFGSMIPDLEPENGMQIFSETAIINDQVNDLDFENPFAYYRFDPGHTGFPNLIIRHAYYPPGDEFLQVGGTPEPAEFVRYSWGNGDGLIQFKLGLLGRHSPTTTLNLGRFSVRTMDYAGLPSWVVSRQWDFETFVASELGGYRSSEGIYDWDYVAGDFSWVFGDSSRLPLDAYRTITPGLRGEYRVLAPTPPQLYIDPLDRRLHLLGAQGGTWSVDPQQTISTSSLDGQTVGRWLRSIDGVAWEALYAVPQALLYAGNDAVTVQAEPPMPAIVPISPPNDEATLATLRRQLPANPPNIAERGLETLLDASGLGSVQLTGATLTHVKLVQGGWRAELDLGSATAVLPGGGDSPLLPVLLAALGCGPVPAPAAIVPCSQGNGHGHYVLRYDGHWHVQAATAADVQIAAMQVGAGLPALAELPVTVSVTNDGATDSTDQEMQIWAQRPGDRRIRLTRLALNVPAGERRDFSLSWLPSGPGRWSVTAEIVGTGPAAGASPSDVTSQVTIPAAGWPAWWTLGPIPSRRLIGGAIGLLLTVSLLTAVTVWVILR